MNRIGGATTTQAKDPAPTGRAPSASANSPSFAADIANFTYVMTHRPQGVGPLLRMIKGLVSKGNALGSSAKQAARLDILLKHPKVAAIMSHFPSGMGEKLKKVSHEVADSKLVTSVEKFSQKPGYLRASGFLLKAAPVLGLACAPFDFMNMLEVCHDPKVSLFHKSVRVARTATGTLMCLGGVLGFLLPACGAPAAGALALSIGGKIGLANLLISLPSFFTLAEQGADWAGKAMSGLARQL